eukprot:g913.t1
MEKEERKRRVRHKKLSVEDNTKTICVGGSSKTEYKDGEARRLIVKIGRRNDATTKFKRLEDGSTLLTFEDGRQAQIFPDGVYVSLHPSCKIQIHPDGTTIRETSDNAILTRPDGMTGFLKSSSTDDEPIPFHLSPSSNDADE